MKQKQPPRKMRVFQWMGQGRLEFDRAALREAFQRENLLAGSVPTTICYGVKSFEHPIDSLALRCADVLDLTTEFDERFIRDEADWVDSLYPRMAKCLLEAARDQDRLRLALDAHATLAFAAGSILDLKSGRAIELEQRSAGRQIWSANEQFGPMAPVAISGCRLATGIKRGEVCC